MELYNTETDFVKATGRERDEVQEGVGNDDEKKEGREKRRVGAESWQDIN